MGEEFLCEHAGTSTAILMTLQAIKMENTQRCKCKSEANEKIPNRVTVDIHWDLYFCHNTWRM